MTPPAPPDPFAEACGATAAVDLRIERLDGVLLTQGELDIPCGLVGRDPACEVTLSDPQVDPRHAFIQVVGGRVMVADLGSRAGVLGPDGRRPFVWVGPGKRAQVGPFLVSLRRPAADRPVVPDPDFDPFRPHPATAGLPKACVRFLNGRTGRGEWVVNRAVSVVGRSEACKVRLAADEVADFHAYFLLTGLGLWVVDLLSGNPVRVNGDPVRYARLADGDTVTVGRFGMKCVYQTEPRGEKPAASGKPAAAGRPGAAAAGFPEAADLIITPLLHRMSEAQNQMLEQFQQSVREMAAQFGETHYDQIAAMRREMDRMADLNAEMQRLQSQVSAGPAPRDQQARVTDRLAALQAERHGIWQRLVGMLSATPTAKPPKIGSTPRGLPGLPSS